MEQEKKKGRGGYRPGAGRKARGETPRNTILTFRVSEVTASRMKALREATKGEETDFVDMLDSWVKGMAQDYGIE